MAKLSELSWCEVDNYSRDDTVVFVPIGTTEEHGPHLPLGTDYYMAELSAQEASAQFEKKTGCQSLLLPTIQYGYTGGTKDFPGNICIQPETLTCLVYDIANSLIEHQFKKFVICNCHFAPDHITSINKAFELLFEKYGNIKYSDPWYKYLKSIKLNSDMRNEGHAGAGETSIMMYLKPEKVKFDKLYDLPERYIEISHKSFKASGAVEGYIGSPAKSDIKTGHYLYNQMVECFLHEATKIIK